MRTTRSQLPRARRGALLGLAALVGLSLGCAPDAGHAPTADSPAPAETAGPDAPLSDASFAAWRDHVLPSEAESGWQELPWYASYAEGVLAADEQRRPLLLWIMNGHPLGCT